MSTPSTWRNSVVTDHRNTETPSCSPADRVLSLGYDHTMYSSDQPRTWLYFQVYALYCHPYTQWLVVPILGGFGVSLVVLELFISCFLASNDLLFQNTAFICLFIIRYEDMMSPSRSRPALLMSVMVWCSGVNGTAVRLALVFTTCGEVYDPDWTIMTGFRMCLLNIRALLRCMVVDSGVHTYM